MRTVPVNQSSGPFLDSCEPTLLISIFHPFIEPTLPLTCGETDKLPNLQYNSYTGGKSAGANSGCKAKTSQRTRGSGHEQNLSLQMSDCCSPAASALAFLKLRSGS